MALHVLRITTAKCQPKGSIGRLATDVPCATPAVYLGGCGRSRSAEAESVRINPRSGRLLGEFDEMYPSTRSKLQVTSTHTQYATNVGVGNKFR